MSSTSSPGSLPPAKKIFAYSYSDPLLESVPDVSVWGQQVDQVYQDMGNRQQLDQLLQDCQATSVAYVLIRRLEELGDSLQEVSDRLAELETLGVPLFVTQDTIGTGEQSTGKQGMTRSDLLYVLQALQESQRRQTLRRGHARNRIKALPPPGKAPYGYRRGKERYAIDRSTAPVVKDFVDYFLLYGSLRGSVRYLQKKYNKKISVSTGKRWLTSPVYRGDLVYQTGDVVQNTHVAIISREEAAQIDRLLRRNRRMPPRTASSPRSLSGLAKCDACQSPMKISRVTTRNTKAQNAKEYLYLSPTSCPRRPKCRSIPYDQALDCTIQRICKDLPQAVANTPLPDVDRIKQGVNAEIAAKQEILNQLLPLVNTGVLDQETADLRAYKVRTEIAALQTQAAQLPPVNLKTIAQVVSIPQFWWDLSESERRFYFREFIREIHIRRSDNAPEEWDVQLVFIF